MRQLLQFATMLLILTAFVTPLVEFFDRWDAPGLSNDSEAGIFCLVLVLCLVLLVCRRVASLAVRLCLVARGAPQPLRMLLYRSRGCDAVELFSPPRSTPLRI